MSVKQICGTLNCQSIELMECGIAMSTIKALSSNGKTPGFGPGNFDSISNGAVRRSLARTQAIGP